MKHAATVNGQLGTANAETQRLGRQRQWRAMTFMLIAWFILSFAGSIMLATQLSKQNIDAITIFVGTGGFLGAMFLWVGLTTGVPMFDNMRIADGREAQLVEMLNQVVPKLKQATASGREKGEALSLLPELDTLVTELDRLIKIYGISGTPQQAPAGAKTSDDMRDVNIDNLERLMRKLRRWSEGEAYGEIELAAGMLRGRNAAAYLRRIFDRQGLNRADIWRESDISKRARNDRGVLTWIILIWIISWGANLIINLAK